MASNSFLHHLTDLDFTNEEQGAVFTPVGFFAYHVPTTPTIQWDSSSEDSNLLIIGKLVTTRTIDDLAVIRAFQGIWKKEKVALISVLKPNFFRIKFSYEDSRNDILSRGKKADASNIDIVTKDTDPTPDTAGPSKPTVVATVLGNKAPVPSTDTAAATKDTSPTLPPAANAHMGDNDAGSSSNIPTTAVLSSDFLADDVVDTTISEDFVDVAAATEENIILPSLTNGPPVNNNATGDGSPPLAIATTTLNASHATNPVLDNDMGKSLLPTWEVLVHFVDWMLNDSTNLAFTDNALPPLQVNTTPPIPAPRGNKRRSSLPDATITKSN
ncbi:hypothetical protein V6N13_104759 [Hibiscus sabdariffa]